MPLSDKAKAGARSAIDQPNRQRIAASWDARLTKLEKNRRKADKKYSRASFCKDHSLNRFMVLRYIKGDRTPSWEAINLINTALETEGV